MKIKKRIYYLYQPSKKRYQRASYTMNSKEDRLVFEKEQIALSRLKKIFSDYLNPQTKRPRFINSKLKEIFWHYADEQARLALTFAYHQKITLKNNKIPNMEIGNWKKVPFFLKHHQNLRSQTLPKNILRPLRSLRSRLDVSGRHLVSLRFENIHLAIDLVTDRLIFTIHWDRHPPQSPLSWIKHMLFEDQKS